MIPNVSRPRKTTLYGVSPEGDRLTLARQVVGVSQEDMGKLCGLSRTHYMSLEKGLNKLNSHPTREKLAIGFGVTTAELNQYLDHGGDPAEFVAKGKKRGALVTTTETEERYPNRRRGALAATHLFPITVDQALAYAFKALDAGDEGLPDQTAEWWLEQISAAYKRERRGVSVGVVVPPSDID